MNAKKNTGKARLKLPVHVYLGYLLVATLIFTGVTLSKYITSTNAGDSARAAAFGDLQLTENDKPAKFIIAPGANIRKNPLVSFGVNEPSESSAYVFVVVFADGEWKFDETANTYKIMRGEKEIMSWSVDPNWKFVAKDGYFQAFYRYLSPQEQLNNVPVIKNGEITVSPELYASEYADLGSAYKSITFQACAVQGNGFGGPEHAWWSLYHKYKYTE